MKMFYNKPITEVLAVRIIDYSKRKSLVYLNKTHLIHDGLSKTIDWYLTKLDK